MSKLNNIKKKKAELLKQLKELEAKEILDFGWSTGACVIAEDDFKPSDDKKVKYLPIFYDAPPSIGDFVKKRDGKIGEWAIKFFCLDFNLSAFVRKRTDENKKTFVAQGISQGTLPTRRCRG